MKKNVVVVGGGIAGLAAAIYLARGGCNVTIFEKRRHVGGRAITHLRHGFRFNLGPHMVIRKGAGRTVYRELGIPIRGGRSRAHGTGFLEKRHYTLPLTPLSLVFTSLLNTKGKIEAAKVLRRIWNRDANVPASMTIGEWLDANVIDARVRLVLEALVRLATYSPELGQSASTSLSQVSLLLRGVVYIDEGWQKIVDALQTHAVTSGVNFVTSSRVIRVDHDGAVRGLELGGLEEEERDTTVELLRPHPAPANATGARIAAENVILAVDPATAQQLVGDADFARGWSGLKPVTAACLDVALSKLPNSKRTFAIGFDRPVYFGVHSMHAQLTPHGGAMVHVAKYQTERLVSYDDNYDDDLLRMNDSTLAVERELESLLDELQPGWQPLVVHRRFLPSLTVSNALMTPDVKRPPSTTAVQGLYLAGDWVGDEGIMADAALWSARTAAKAILDPLYSAPHDR